MLDMKNNTERPEGYTTSQFAERTGIAQKTIMQWVYRGKLESVKALNGYYNLIPQRELDRVLREQEAIRKQLERGENNGIAHKER